MLWYHFICAILLTTHSSSEDVGVQDEEWAPYFGRPIGNVTVALGREAVLACNVKNLGSFKVGWLKAEDRTVLTLDRKVVTHNSRISVTQDVDQDTWKLHIRQLKHSDRGCYMCQINTTHMKKQIGCLDVHVPPDIVDTGTSSDMTVTEGDNVTLICRARGHPPPRILWRREDGQLLTVFQDGKYSTVDSYVGERLHLVKAEYTQMGAYLCIATNDIPPAVSKRIVLQVNFHPILKFVNQQVVTGLGTTVTLKCVFDAFPSDETSWHREIGDIQEYGGEYEEEVTKSWYEVTLYLTIKNMRPIDFGRYFCRVGNSIGVAHATIQIYEVRIETTTTTTEKTTTQEMTAEGQETTRPALRVTTESNSVEELVAVNEMDIEDREDRGGVEASSPRRSYNMSRSSYLGHPSQLLVILSFLLPLNR